MIVLLIQQTLQAQEDFGRYDPNPSKQEASNLRVNVDLGYTQYLIDVTSTELSRAIDYTLYEATLGVSYNWGYLNVGLNTKLILDEDQSNLTLGSANNPLNDTADIKRHEFYLYSNYRLSPQFQINLVYRYSNLEASDHYTNFWEYDTYFKYTTNGLVSSITWVPFYSDHYILWFNSGLTYTQTDVEIFENIDGVADDAFIDDSQQALGFKVSAGYTYRYDEHINIRLSGDWYYYDFGKLDVTSHTIGDTFDKASLKEQTYSLRLGVSYKF